MDMTEPRKFENEVRPLRLSEAIRRGHRMILEDVGCFLVEDRGCALGAAWIGSGKTEREYWEIRWSNPGMHATDIIASHLALPIGLVMRISREHFEGTPRLQIAAELEAQGL